MKHLTITLLAVLLWMPVNVHSETDKKAKKTETVVFIVNMDCQGCVDGLTKELTYTKGVKDLNISLEKKTVEIEYRTNKTTPDLLKKRITKLGYVVKLEGDKADTPGEKDASVNHKVGH